MISLKKLIADTLIDKDTKKISKVTFKYKNYDDIILNKYNREIKCT